MVALSTIAAGAGIASAAAGVAGSIGSFIQGRNAAGSAPGATAAQKGLLSVSQENLARLQAMQGMGAREVQNVQQLGQAEQQQAQSAVSAVQASTLSPLERQRLGASLLARQREMAIAMQKKIDMLDLDADMKRNELIANNAAKAAQQAEQIRMANIQRREMQARYKALGVKMATDMMVGGFKTLATFYPASKQDDPQTEAVEGVGNPTLKNPAPTIEGNPAVTATIDGIPSSNLTATSIKEGTTEQYDAFAPYRNTLSPTLDYNANIPSSINYLSSEGYNQMSTDRFMRTWDDIESLDLDNLDTLAIV